MIYTGDALKILPTLEAESVDSIVTDPPYGLSFMGKEWDHGIPGSHFWSEALRVAKPGAFLLAFGGTRTFHRLAVAIEDAGWEIRDTVMWVYGSGFPKSLDVSKAIDKAAGVPREKIGESDRGSGAQPHKLNAHGKGDTGIGYMDGSGKVFDITAPASDAARQWEGWGTALKPAVEYIVCAQKPLTLHGLCIILVQNIGGAICQLPSFVKPVENRSTSNQNECGGESSSALWSAVVKCNTPGDLFDLMDTLPSGSEIPSSLSTGLSWLRSLAVLSQAMSTFTTETESSLTMDLKTLNSLPSMNTQGGIIRELTREHGTESSVSLVESIFNVVNAKLDSILTPSAPGLVTSPDGSSALRPNWRPIIVARKPLVGTVAENVLKYGTGGMNIDGCRVETGDNLNGGGYSNGESKGMWTPGEDGGGLKRLPGQFIQPQGRWPANLIHDGSDEVVGLFPQSSITGNRVIKNRVQQDSVSTPFTRSQDAPEYTDSGSAARFFYCAKASKQDRDEGCEGLPFIEGRPLGISQWEGQTNGSGQTMGPSKPCRNNHPTVKPLALMRYLCRLVTPPGGLILDPFMGSGSTGKAATLEGFQFIGIELEKEYAEIAAKRIEAARLPLLEALR